MAGWWNRQTRGTSLLLSYPDEVKYTSNKGSKEGTAMPIDRDACESAVRESVSIAEVIRRLGLQLTTTSYVAVKRLIRVHNFNTNHFLGRGRNCGEGYVGGIRKLPWQEVLVLRVAGY